MTVRPLETAPSPVVEHLPLERRAMTKLLAQVLREWPGSMLQLSRLTGWTKGKKGLTSRGVSPIYLSNLQRGMVPATPTVVRKIVKTLRSESARMMRLADRLERELGADDMH